MLIAAAVVPVPPLLVPEIAAGSADADEPMRTACRDAVERLCAAGPDEVIVIGAGDSSGPVDGSWDWRGFGVPLPDPAPKQSLPHALAIGAWLLDTYAGTQLPRRCWAVPSVLPPDDCAALGRELVGDSWRFGLLLCGDGSARRTEKAPGSFDPAAEPWDDAAVSALREADPRGLLALDPTIGARLLAAGRAPWQVLAGAAGNDAFDATIDYAAAPYGVMYVVGTWISATG